MGLRLKSKEVLKNDYVRTIIFLAIMILGVMSFWFGLKAVLRIEYPLLAVASPSMVPTLNVGDLIVVQGGLGAPYDDIDAGPPGPDSNGTIIVFRGEVIGRPGELIVHRTIQKEYNNGVWYFTTHGDNNPKGSNEIFSEEYLIGKVVGYIPLIGHIPLFVREPYGMMIIVVLMLVLIFAEFLPIWKRKEKPQPCEDASSSQNVPEQ